MRLLVISFYFPPSKLVAVRRWAKHLKYLAQNDFDFTVLTINHPDDNSPWQKDIESYKNKIERIEYNITHPFFKSRLPQNVAEKIRWHLSYYFWRFIYKKPNTLFADDSIGSEELFYKRAGKLIEEKQITHLVLTVGPHRLSTILPRLKRNFPSVKLFIDYRDYWHDKEEKMANELLKKELAMENKVLEVVDGIIVVNNEMGLYFKNKMNNEKPVFVLPHCYDPDDVVSIESSVEIKEFAKSDTLKFVYGGALYANMESYVECFVKVLNSFMDEGWDVRFDSYLPYKAYEKELSNIKGGWSVNGMVGTNDFFKIVKDAGFVLYFRPDWSPNAFSSKFYELIACRKPILYFGPKGDVSDFIIKNNIGFFFDLKNQDESLTALKSFIAGKWQFNKQYDLTEHTFNFQNKKLLGFLNSV